MSLYMKELDEEGKELPHDIQVSIRQVIYQCARSGRLFKIGNGHVVFFILKKQYRDYEKRVKSILEAFHPLYEKFRYDYKINMAEGLAILTIASGRSPHIPDGIMSTSRAAGLNCCKC